MTTFDAMEIDCRCGEKLLVQSTIAGNTAYPQPLLPPAVAADLIGRSTQCPKCQLRVDISGAVLLLPTFARPDAPPAVPPLPRRNVKRGKTPTVRVQRPWVRKDPA